MYYFLPPDAVAPSPPLIPRRTSRNYENINNVNVKDRDAATHTQRAGNCPPLPPKKSYENVELKPKGSKGASLSSPNAPIPLKRSRVPRTPPREQQVCPITPPFPRRSREQQVCPITPPLPRRLKDKSSEKSMLLKSASAPFSPISQDSPELPRKKLSDSSSLVLSMEENDDVANSFDNPSPYYSLPPDISPTNDILDDFDIKGSMDEEDMDMYLTLDDKVLPPNKASSTKTKVHVVCPPLPPKVR